MGVVAEIGGIGWAGEATMATASDALDMASSFAGST